MLHARAQGHWPSVSGEDFIGFYHIWAWRPSCSCDQDHLNKFLFLNPKEPPYEICLVVSEKTMF